MTPAWTRRMTLLAERRKNDRLQRQWEEKSSRAGDSLAETAMWKEKEMSKKISFVSYKIG